jgi:hypothetical protein
MVKGTKVPTSSVPQPLISRVVTIEQSDSDSEQSAQFASIQQQHKYVVPDYRILTAGHNETVLGVFAIFLEKSAPCLCWKRDRTIGTQFHAYRWANLNAYTGIPVDP